MISGRTTRAMQLRLDLAESPAPAAVLWELVGAEERRAAIAQLSALIAGAVVGPVVGRSWRRRVSEERCEARKRLEDGMTELADLADRLAESLK